MIINETYDFIKSANAEMFRNTTIERVVIGIHFTAVKLSSGFAGVAKTEIEDNCCYSSKSKRNFGAFTPGKIHGQKILDLFEKAEKSDILDNVRLAVLNAVSSEMISHLKYKVIEDKDPIDLLDLSKEKTICIVGAFQSYMNKIAATKNKLFVLELNENAFDENQKQFYVPAADYKKTFAKSDIIVITGATLANNTLDTLLDYIPAHTQTILVGPSSSFVPDILFKHKVNIIGSTKILNAEKMFTLIAEGAAGYHLFEYCAKKICIINGN
ncbi:MAG: DUF364 domain-containing protein [Bacteroidales bacterium]|jgi:uncharacterized protein (DUF4213/DUF364 family)